MAGEKTEKATSKRKQDERKKGNIFQSKELVTVFSLVVMFYSFKLLSPFIIHTVEESIRLFSSLASTTGRIETPEVTAYLLESIIIYAKTALPLLMISGLVAIVITFAQTKMLVSFKAIEPKFNRMNPLEGIKKMFSLRGVVELVKSLLKVAVLGYIVYSKFSDRIAEIPKLMDMEPIQAVAFVSDFIISLVLTVGAIFLFLAVADYVYQWYDYEKNLRMSKDEIKEEYKQTEGDPQIKGKIKQKQREMSQGRMMQEVPKADVIIRNPTHYAVALSFDPDKNNAPLLLAKGTDLLALRIVRVAEQHDIMTIENKPLARGLYESVKLNHEIPEKFYGAVAEVLAFVYSLKKKDLKL